MRVFLFYLFFGMVSFAYGQTSDTVYFSNVWKVTSPQNAVFTRIGTIDSSKMRFIGPVTDYYPSGEVFMTGNYSNEGLKHGEFNWLFANGTPFMTGQFSNDSINGIWKMYFSNGKLRQKIGFNKNDFTIWELFNDAGLPVITNGTGELKDIEVGVNPTIYIRKATQQDGKRTGKWTFLYQTSYGVKEYQEEYKGDFFYVGFEKNTAEKEKYYYSLLSSQLYYPPNLRIMESMEPDRAYVESVNFERVQRGDTMIINGEVFTIVEQQPEFPGGMSAFYNSIARTLRYPSEARRMGIEGKVFVQFVINQDGSITEIEVIRGIGAGCDQEAIRAIQVSGRWLPGLQRGAPVKVRMVLPITFKLG
ncbi:MAG: TonB family protein [Imperialibacter sp.]|uniref:TonB family protein n=1 Tax=Imperialibacter sp. TaxID=2038411 RepID=UPI0032EC7F31